MKKRAFIPALAVLTLVYAATATAGQIVATVPPLHSLVAAVLGDTAKPVSLLNNKASPHDFHLKPSQLDALRSADVIFYIDERLETFLPDVFETLPRHIRKVAVSKAPGLTLLERRSGGHNHSNRSRDAHDEHHHDDHDDDDDDLHIWLDPENAISIIAFIAEELSSTYPSNQGIYRSNARKMTEKVRQLDAKIRPELAALRNKPFVVFHDAYQYFERRYQLAGVGSITQEGRSPTPGDLQQIRKKLIATGASCAFREPQFSDRLISTVIEGTDVKIGVLDPVGIDLPLGETLYLRLIEKLATNLKKCLG